MPYDDPIAPDRYWDDRSKEKMSDLEKALREAAHAASRNIAIQFECGDCCKVVENGRDLNVLGDYVVGCV